MPTRSHKAWPTSSERGKQLSSPLWGQPGRATGAERSPTPAEAITRGAKQVVAGGVGRDAVSGSVRSGGW